MRIAARYLSTHCQVAFHRHNWRLFFVLHANIAEQTEKSSFANKYAMQVVRSFVCYRCLYFHSEWWYSAAMQVGTRWKSSRETHEWGCHNFVVKISVRNFWTKNSGPSTNKSSYSTALDAILCELSLPLTNGICTQPNATIPRLCCVRMKRMPSVSVGSSTAPGRKKMLFGTNQSSATAIKNVCSMHLWYSRGHINFELHSALLNGMEKNMEWRISLLLLVAALPVLNFDHFILCCRMTADEDAKK